MSPDRERLAVAHDLVAALLHDEDRDFWGQWDRVARLHESDARAELDAHVRWIAERVGRPNYRGCPQLNVAAEFPDDAHPARLVATAHKRELLRRLDHIAVRMEARRPHELATHLLLLINGAFVSSIDIEPDEASRILLGVAHALLAAARS